MASGWTDKGLARMFAAFFQDGTEPTNFYVALVTDAVAPTKATNTLGELTEIAAGNGYATGGFQLERDGVDFDVLTEADPTVIQVKDIVWTASGGPLPASGGGARWAILTDDNGVIANREIIAWHDLGSPRTVSDGQSLTVQDMELNGDLP